jgi:hypothetical protein
MKIETDFAVIDVAPKGDETPEFLMRHTLHQVLRKYKQDYGQEATEAVLNELRGYHGGSDNSEVEILRTNEGNSSFAKPGTRTLRGRLE